MTELAGGVSSLVQPRSRTYCDDTEDTARDAREATRWFRSACRDGELDLPAPGAGQTATRFAALADLAARDLVHARLGEGHADAVAILAELGGPSAGGHSWGVWAARPETLTAAHGPGGWTVTGVRAWCSGAQACTRALVTANTREGTRLFVVDPAAAGVCVLGGTWPALGMAGSDSRTVRFEAVPATPVGSPGDYTQRPGFWHGAMGVAACWYGGATGVGRRLLHAVNGDDPHALAHLGGVDTVLAAAAATLAGAAAAIDAEPERDLQRLALQVRTQVEAAATEVLGRVGRALGAEPLGHDRVHARRVADLTVYLRQSHAERDLAELGGLVSATEDPAAAWSLRRRTAALRDPR